MALTPDQILQEVIGQLYIQLAVVQSALECAKEELAAIKEQLARKESNTQ